METCPILPVDYQSEQSFSLHQIQRQRQAGYRSKPSDVPRLRSHKQSFTVASQTAGGLSTSPSSRRATPRQQSKAGDLLRSLVPGSR